MADKVNVIKVNGIEHRVYHLPTSMDETFLYRLDEYILKAQYNLEVFSLMVGEVRDSWVQAVNSRERKVYTYMREHGAKDKATTLKDLARAHALDEIEAANIAEALYKRFLDFREVALEKLQTYKKIKRGGVND